jgi:hypothetical protein
MQGCQSFLDKIYQNGGKYTKMALNYQMAVKYSKWPNNIPTFPISRPSKIYPNWDFGFEKIPSGNPECIYLPSTVHIR